MSRSQVLVTGGARRLGAAIARGFADAGWHVVVHCNGSRVEAERLVAALPSAELVACDLGDPAAATALVAELAARLDDWRCLVGNAAIFPHDDPQAIGLRAGIETMQINALTPALMAQAFLTHARSTGPRCVVQLTDQKLVHPNPDFFSYTMSKAAVDMGMRMLAQVAARRGDRVYRLAPGAILASHDQSEEEAELSHRLNLLGRRTGADEIAAAALFLAGGALESGQCLIVDSGQHLLAQSRDVIYLAREGG